MTSVFNTLLLAAAICLDSFAASFAFGTEEIKIPSLSAVVLSLVCSGTLAVTLLLGNLIGPVLPENFAKGLSFGILFLLGIARLLDSLIKRQLRKNSRCVASLNFRFLSFDFFLRICADNTEADRDRSKILTPAEAAPLSLALSLDGLAAGLGAGIAGLGVLPTFLVTFLMNLIFVALGAACGRLLASRSELNLSWLGGAVLLALAFRKLR